LDEQLISCDEPTSANATTEAETDVRKILHFSRVETTGVDDWGCAFGNIVEPTLRDEVIGVLAEDGFISTNGIRVGENDGVGGDPVAFVLILGFGEVRYATDDDRSPTEGLGNYQRLSDSSSPCTRQAKYESVRLTDCIDVGQLRAILESRQSILPDNLIQDLLSFDSPFRSSQDPSHEEPVECDS
jgi:hypothetical protein